jgi:hypothetical protein
VLYWFYAGVIRTLLWPFTKRFLEIRRGIKQRELEPAEPESSVCSDMEWNELAYGPGSTWFDTEMLIDSISEELEAPLNRARNAADFVLREAKQDAADILYEAKAERDEAEEVEFYEWMKDGSIRSDAHLATEVQAARDSHPYAGSDDLQRVHDCLREKLDRFDQGGFIPGDTTIESWGYNNVEIRRFRGRP